MLINLHYYLANLPLYQTGTYLPTLLGVVVAVKVALTITLYGNLYPLPTTYNLTTTTKAN